MWRNVHNSSAVLHTHSHYRIMVLIEIIITECIVVTDESGELIEERGREAFLLLSISLSLLARYSV